MTIWPLDDGSFGLDATFHGASGYERAEFHTKVLDDKGVPHSFRQELEGAWTVRLSPISAHEVARALDGFLY